MGSFCCHREHEAENVRHPPPAKSRGCSTASCHIYRFKLKNVVRVALHFLSQDQARLFTKP